MRIVFLLVAFILTTCAFAGAQSAITSGSFSQTISADIPGQQGNSQVSSLSINTAGFSARYDSFDNHTDTRSIFLRGGTPEVEWIYDAGHEVRGSLTYPSGGHLNHLVASANSPDQSTRLVFTFAPHALPKIRPNQTQLVVPVTFTVTGRFAVFGSVGPGVPPEASEQVVGQGTGTLIYRRRSSQFNIKAWRQSPQANLYLASISLTFAGQ